MYKRLHQWDRSEDRDENAIRIKVKSHKPRGELSLFSFSLPFSEGENFCRIVNDESYSHSHWQVHEYKLTHFFVFIVSLFSSFFLSLHLLLSSIFLVLLPPVLDDVNSFSLFPKLSEYRFDANYFSDDEASIPRPRHISDYVTGSSSITEREKQMVLLIHFL